MSVQANDWSFKLAMQPGLRAVRSLWRPMLLIQSLAIVLVVVYYRSPGFQEIASRLQEWKIAGGLLFAFAAGAIAGGIIPAAAKAVTRSCPDTPAKQLKDALWNGLIFGLVGVFVDVFYQFQGQLFGTGTDPLTLAKKTAVDMGLFSPFFAIPFEVATLRWPQVRFRVSELFRVFNWTFYRETVIPALLPCWAFWIPVLFCVYAMPMNLQFCFAILAEAAWSIIVVSVATENDQTSG